MTLNASVHAKPYLFLEARIDIMSGIDIIDVLEQMLHGCLKFVS